MISTKYLKGIVLFGFLSCRTSDKFLQDPHIRDTIVSYKVVMIPKDFSGTFLNDTAFEKNLAKMLDLPVLSEGSNDSNLRIWLWDEDVKYVINLIGIDTEIKCDVTGWNSRHTDSGEVIIVQHHVVNVQPTSGWTSISAELGKLEKVLQGGPYKGQIGAMTLMTYVVFELSGKNSYFYGKYLEPSFHRYVHPDALVIHNFLKILNKELGLKAYLPLERLYAEPNEDR